MKSRNLMLGAILFLSLIHILKTPAELQIYFTNEISNMLAAKGKRDVYKRQQQNSGSASEWALASFFGRINYSFKDRYLLEMSARYDASSRFPKSKRWGLDVYQRQG